MPNDLTDTLCTQCGLCCDGSLFDDVALADQNEAAKLDALGLAIDAEAPPLLLQPCTALCNKRCRIYQDRPAYCRTFECRLLQGAQAERIKVDEAQQTIELMLEHVEHIKELCRQSGSTDETLPLKMRCVEVLSQPIDCADDQANERRSALARAMDHMGSLIQTHFLGD